MLYGIRSDMPAFILTRMFWARLVFPFALMFPAMKLAERLGRPGASVSTAWFTVTMPIIAMLLVTGGFLLATPSGYRLKLMFGTGWSTTLANIVLLSLPPLAIVMRAMRGLAPTRLALAGSGAGLLAGAQGVLVFSLYCSQMHVPFWGIWYVLSVLIMSAIGAAIAPACLRW
jgi:hypothetical protein